jgi:hypothetical protein
MGPPSLDFFSLSQRPDNGTTQPRIFHFIATSRQWDHPASCSMGTGGSFPGGKARPGRDTDNSPPSSAEVKYE